MADSKEVQHFVDLQVDVATASRPEVAKARLSCDQEMASMTPTPGLRRRNAMRWPAESVIRTTADDTGPGLTRSNAIRRPRTASRPQPRQAADVADSSKNTTKVPGPRVKFADPPTRGHIQRASGDRLKRPPSPRPSRFIEHLCEDDESVSEDSAGDRHGLSEACSKVKEYFKNAMHRRPSYAGIRVYEGT